MSPERFLRRSLSTWVRNVLATFCPCRRNLAHPASTPVSAVFLGIGDVEGMRANDSCESSWWKTICQIFRFRDIFWIHSLPTLRDDTYVYLGFRGLTCDISSKIEGLKYYPRTAGSWLS